MLASTRHGASRNYHSGLQRRGNYRPVIERVRTAPVGDLRKHLIIVDDRSTDGTGEYLKGLSLDYVNLVSILLMLAPC